MKQPDRINDGMLEWNEGAVWDSVRLFDGKPYSGTAFCEYSEGALKSERLFLNGLEEGHCKEWHDNGQLKKEWIASRGRELGKVTKWHANGAIHSIAEFDQGVELCYREWDESGKPILTRTIEGNSELI